jgi:phosphohistidine phosphatase SixA
MGRFIDFICHGDAMLPRGSNSDDERVLSPLGHRQAVVFGQARKQAGETYGLALYSDVLRTEETFIAMKPFLGSKIREVIVPELFDPEEPDKYSRIRQAAYTKLGAQPLEQYLAECDDAMRDLGWNANKAISPLIEKHSDKNILIIGHQVYLNAIIYEWLLIHGGDLVGLSIKYSPAIREAKNRLLTDPPLQPCAGYRLLIDDYGSLYDMLRLPPIVLDI